MRNNRKILRKYLLTFLGVSILLLILVNSHLDCYERDYIFVREYNADYNSKNETTLPSCKGCLWIDAMPINNAYILGFKNNPPSNELQEDIVKTNTDRLFFAGETELKGFKPYSRIVMKWCQTPNGQRIRGVWSE